MYIHKQHMNSGNIALGKIKIKLFFLNIYNSYSCAECVQKKIIE